MTGRIVTGRWIQWNGLVGGYSRPEVHEGGEAKNGLIRLT